MKVIGKEINGLPYYISKKLINLYKEGITYIDLYIGCREYISIHIINARNLVYELRHTDLMIKMRFKMIIYDDYFNDSHKSMKNNITTETKSQDVIHKPEENQDEPIYDKYNVYHSLVEDEDDYGDEIVLQPF